HGHDHQVRGPAVHVAQQAAKRHVIFEIENVAKRLNLRRMVIKHQHYAGEDEHDEEIKSDSAQAPGVTVARGVAIHFCRMNVEEKIVERGERAIARLIVVLDAENGAIELRFLRLLQLFDLLLSLDLQDFAELFAFFFQSETATVAVPVLLFRHSSAFGKKLNAKR